jgi:hypothetical protein
MSTDDPIVEEVRSIRDDLSAKFDFNIEAIFADLRRRQAEHGSRLVRQGAEEWSEHLPETRGKGVS